MLGYDDILMLCDDAGLIVKEKKLTVFDGLIFDRRVAVRSDIETSAEKSQVLAEELGHHYLTVGNILDQTDVNNRRQERIARDFGYDLKIGLDGIISAFEAGCRNKYEIAEHLNCTVTYLTDAIERYHQKYGLFAKHGNYVICFEPLYVAKNLQGRCK